MSIPLYICTTTFYPFIGRHLYFFHVVDIVDTDARNIWIHVSFWIIVFSGRMPNSVISGSCGSFMGFRGSSAGRESMCSVGESSSNPGLGRPPGEGIGRPLQYLWASLVAQTIMDSPALQETGFGPWVGKFPWRRAWQPTWVVLPGESPWAE